ncbi:hypothetical protein [Rheinheimera pacifica]|uniref:hypothetical protein n=1 Tax=Rheinheimera pacifica TaxID=173990 RepID=UPI002ED7B950
MTNHANTSSQQSQSVHSSKAKLKQAVVVIHGMGEQHPMETIREFVNHVWKQDGKLHEPHFWNKPSSVSESFEQRRITTDSPKINDSENRVSRTDFYEYYWAHHTVGTKWEHFVGWFLTLLKCPPSRYSDHPGTLQPLWYILWALLLICTVSIGGWLFIVSCLIGYFESHHFMAFLLGILITGIEATALLYINKIRKFFTDYFGDVARYVRANPANITIRQEIRKGGIELLERIHQTGDYNRIVLVGHSLGSIIAYDILNHLWSRHNKFQHFQNGQPVSKPLSDKAKQLADELQAITPEHLKSKFCSKDYWRLQRELFDDLTSNDQANNWLISDFVTLGSPLTYADILLFDNKQQFIKRKLDREYPTSPPLTEKGSWYYGGDSDCYLHHGAVFAAVKWTNIYMPHTCFLKGDLISGPVSNNFSYQHFDNEKGEMTPPSDLTKSPIHEIALDWSKIKNGFTHTDYWIASSPESNHLIKLREAIALY